MTNFSKKKIRSLMSKVLAGLSDQLVEAESTSVCEKVLNLPEWKKSKNICLFMNMPKMEIRTHDLVNEALKQGKNVFLPRCEGRHTMSMYQVYNTNHLIKNQWQIPEPDGSSPKVMDDETFCDLIIMPGVAFDSNLARLGHGRGFYDDFVHRYKAWCFQKPSRCDIFKVGICLSKQVLPNGQIPMSPLDEFLDLLVTPQNIYKRP
ncbi:5-formyltetrahydrofolate cyclo-ligase [Schizosaccharomyces cryophilus OY26]|uniref:5-formyltetrahydrofolate cyclo-ligase n=1 Tax=Schizosaccharomyces cryophilus (strain OY26 / ATCC MYA-4695 / CBS 11777 / NBRC 106824 / NRRL Y48691) TaxID=653667 RepID=S9W7B1_SCHCR|nr:5-formyltetrahydrofolate cyclo-ligase [Schizosaccharomyces cryophilus OY26]EPY53790.1 5-formyltetrahydrofolate cyclo-ligase [Schizosaccharomyces cryophilus OY26]